MSTHSGRRTGTATLPLHGGRAPSWLFERMQQLAPEIVAAIVADHGPAEVLRRLSDPHWFQAFGCVLGFDWHASGLTTVVTGALKAGLQGREADTGIIVAGGKGKTSRKTPDELILAASRWGLDGDRLAHLSRMSAKVDNTAVQDEHQLYHHAFFLTRAGQWAVVQQGMNPALGTARRYHWLGERITSLVEEPHNAVAAERAQGPVLNLVAAESAPARSSIAQLAAEEPGRLLHEAERIQRASRPPAPQISLFDDPGAEKLTMPRRHHVVVFQDVDPRHLSRILPGIYEAGPRDFEAVLALQGVGPKAIRALALMAEVIYGTPASVRDPARFSFAHGGKDGHPYPVDRATYDHSIEWLRQSVRRARMGNTERTAALRRLARWDIAG